MQGYDIRDNLVTRCYEYDDAQLTRCYGATYDAVGNPTSLTDPEGTDVVAVDNLDRLASVTRQVSGQADAVESYAHNAMGALSVNAGVAMDHQRPALSNGQLTDAAVPASWNGQPVVLDAGGRITSLGGATLAYNRRNQLVHVTDGTHEEYYDYDVWGRRIGVIHGDNSGDFYVYEGANVEAILHANPGTTAYSTDFKLLYDGIDHPLRVNAGGTVAYYELDIIGNVRRLRGAGGTDLGGYRYTAFGKLVEATATIEQPLRWQGRLYTEQAGGMYDVRAREWSPELAVFTSADEFRYLTTRGTLWGWPLGNPVRWRDPSGHEWWRSLLPSWGPWVYTFPESQIGWAMGLAGHAMGGGAPTISPDPAPFPGSNYPAVEFRDNPIAEFLGASVTCGHVIVYDKRGSEPLPWDAGTPRHRAHELTHVAQHDILGPFSTAAHVGFMSLSFITSGSYSRTNPLEYWANENEPAPPMP